MAISVVKVIEIGATSTGGLEDATRPRIAKAAETSRNVQAAGVKVQQKGQQFLAST